MAPRFWIAAIALGSIFFIGGCRHCCKRPTSCNGPINGTTGPGGTPFTGSPNLPPQNLPAIEPTPNTNRSAPEILLPSTNSPDTSGYTPAPRGSVILGDPNFDAPAAAIDENKPATKQTTPPPAVEEKFAANLPVGIANYAQVKEGVTYGHRPDFEGLDWLQNNKTKTVLFLRNGKEDDSSDRRQVEMRGMKYKSLTVDPETINANLVAEFNQIVNDTNGRPLFVYDRDGTNAGAMWYLYFRTSEMLKDDEARIRAGRLGLKERGTADQAALWTAVQKYISERNP